MNKTLLITLIAGLAFALAACGADVPTPDSIPTESETGTTYFSVTDAAADMGAVSSVEITFDSLSVQGSGDAWTDIELEEQTFDLLELEAESALALLAEVELAPGTYNQMRLDVTSVQVTDDNGTQEAFLPSGELRLVGQLNVEQGETSSATFDFLVDESLHVTGEGRYIMTPVIDVETRERAEVAVEANNRVRVEGGQTTSRTTLGMDVDGTMREGRPVNVGANISIVDGKVQVRTPAGVRVGVDIGAGVGAIVTGQGNADSGSETSGNSGAQAGAESEGSVQAGDGSVSANASANASAGIESILG